VTAWLCTRNKNRSHLTTGGPEVDASHCPLIPARPFARLAAPAETPPTNCPPPMRAPELLAAFAALTLAACDASAPSAPGAVPDPAAARISAAVVSNETAPFDWTFPDICNGGPVHITGASHTVLTSTRDADGGFHFVGVFNLQNATGVNQVSGATYRVINTRNYEQRFSGDLQTVTAVTVLKLIGAGPLDNTTLRLLNHLTLKPDGTVAVEFFTSDFTCTG
jgi:hypothetical protein